MDARQHQLQHLLTTEAEGWATDEGPALLTTPHRFLLHDEPDDSEWYSGWTDTWGAPETYYGLHVVLHMFGFDTPQALYAAWQDTLGHRTCMPLYLHQAKSGLYVAMVPESVILTQLIALMDAWAMP
jgi:hypothetical protein